MRQGETSEVRARDTISAGLRSKVYSIFFCSATLYPCVFLVPDAKSESRLFLTPPFASAVATYELAAVNTALEILWSEGIVGEARRRVR